MQSDTNDCGEKTNRLKSLKRSQESEIIGLIVDMEEIQFNLPLTEQNKTKKRRYLFIRYKTKNNTLATILLEVVKQHGHVLHTENIDGFWRSGSTKPYQT